MPFRNPFKRQPAQPTDSFDGKGTDVTEETLQSRAGHSGTSDQVQYSESDLHLAPAEGAQGMKHEIREHTSFLQDDGDGSVPIFADGFESGDSSAAIYIHGTADDNWPKITQQIGDSGRDGVAQEIGSSGQDGVAHDIGNSGQDGPPSGSTLLPDTPIGEVAKAYDLNPNDIAVDPTEADDLIDNTTDVDV